MFHVKHPELNFRKMFHVKHFFMEKTSEKWYTTIRLYKGEKVWDELLL